MQRSGEVFVGRREELDSLHAALASACGGAGRLVLLSGEPGIGKTRTAVELACRAGQDGAQVLWGRCHEEAGAPPYWPWTQVLRDLIGTLDDAALREDLGAGGPDVAQLVPELRARLADLGLTATPSDPAAARFRLFASLAHFLIATSRRQPRVVVLDDLHWADAPSLRFLRFLAPDVAASRILLIGTYRENELSRQHPLSDALGDLARAAHSSRLRLRGLGAEEVRDLLTAAAGTVPAPWLVRSIHAQTEGNPLFLREIARYLRERGLLTGAAEAPKPGSAQSLRIPEGVREVIGQRLNRLSPDCNEILRVASVIGREFSLDVLLRACGAERADGVIKAIDEAHDARLVEPIEPDRYQFTHALVRMTLYDELRAGERRRLHRTVGEAIEAMHRSDLDPVLPDLARHFHLAASADNPARAIEYAVRAGKRADAVLAFEDAAGFFETALDLMQQQVEPEPRQQATLLISLGEAQRKANDFDQARETYRRALELARRHGFRELLADAAIGVEVANWRGGYVRRSAIEPLREALTELPASETARRIKGMGALARAQLYAGAVKEAKAIALDAVALARDLGDPAVTARALSILIEFPEEPEDSLALVAAGEEMALMAARAGDRELEGQARFHCATHILELGRMEQCAQAMQELRRVNRDIGQSVFFLYEIGLRATLAMLRGDLAQAEALILEGLRLRTPGTMYSVDPLSVLIFALRREQGRLAELAPVLRAMLAQEDMVVWRPGLALLHLELGDTEAARALFEQMAPDDFGVLPRDGRWTTCLAYLTELCVALRDRERASVLHRLLLPRTGRNLVFGNGCGCAGAADRYLGMLAATMGHWGEAERHFADAIAINERNGSLAPLAHTRRDLAAMLLRRGGPGDAARSRPLLEQALAEARRLGLVALARRAEAELAALAAPPPDPDALTPREAEVLELIAMGRTNADIALVLSIGVNTVATHVRSILAKTGCANRTEAAALALRQGIPAGR